MTGSQNSNHPMVRNKGANIDNDNSDTNIDNTVADTTTNTTTDTDTSDDNNNNATMPHNAVSSNQKDNSFWRVLPWTQLIIQTIILMLGVVLLIGMIIVLVKFMGSTGEAGNMAANYSVNQSDVTGSMVG